MGPPNRPMRFELHRAVPTHQSFGRAPPKLEKYFDGLWWLTIKGGGGIIKTVGKAEGQRCRDRGLVGSLPCKWGLLCQSRGGELRALMEASNPLLALLSSRAKR